ncbi:MAG: hypothetical protein WCR52_11590 [Bacteroidota bacterium]
MNQKHFFLLLLSAFTATLARAQSPADVQAFRAMSSSERRQYVQDLNTETMDSAAIVNLLRPLMDIARSDRAIMPHLFNRLVAVQSFREKSDQAEKLRLEIDRLSQSGERSVISNP